MKTLAKSFQSSLNPMGERVEWRSDKPPHVSGSFIAVVLRGSPDSDVEGIRADSWTVFADPILSFSNRIQSGDTFTRIDYGREELTVQRVSKDETGWQFICTAEARSVR